MATRKKTGWTAFPGNAKSFTYAGDALHKAWGELHAGDTEPFPDAKRAASLIKAAGKAAPKGRDADDVSTVLQTAWTAFHAGDFQGAFEAGESLGPLGASVACKALGIHATYLVEDPDEQLARFDKVAAIAETAVAALPGEANSHYRKAFGLGRYSQGISIAKAIKMGIASKVRESLEESLALSPKHAEAHLALGLYHAEIVAKIGAMMAGLTYGAKATEAEKHLAQALKLTPKAPIAHLEYGNLLLALHGEKREDDAAAAFEKAAKLTPRDAMEWLDARHAASQLE